MPFNFLHPFGFICRFPPVGLSTTSCLYAVSISEFSCAPVPLSNFLHAFGFNISASPVSQQLLALIWFQYLTSPCASHQTSLTSCIHWASISILSRECSAHLLVTHWVSHLLPIQPSSSQFLLFTPLCPTWEHSPGFNV